MGRFERDPDALTTSFFASEQVVHIGVNDVDELKRISRASDGPSRYSLHNSQADDLHSMVILQPSGTYAQPRKHLTKSKIFHIVDGAMVVMVFTDAGEVQSLYHLVGGKTLIVRIAPDLFHTNVSLTEQAIYHEVIAGPYVRESDDRVYAPFAPQADDQEAGKAYLATLMRSVRPDLLA